MSLFSAKPVSLVRPAVTGPMTARVGAEATPTGSASSGLGAGSIVVGAALIIGGVYYYQKVQRENRLQAARDRIEFWRAQEYDYPNKARYAPHSIRTRLYMMEDDREQAALAQAAEEAMTPTIRDRDAGPTVIVLGRKPEPWRP